MGNIRHQYAEKFFGGLTKEEKDRIYFSEFMWHAFSSQMIGAIEGMNAIEEFNKKSKNGVYVFFQNKDVVLEKTDLALSDLITIIKEAPFYYMDCYVADTQFEWTFVCTHETYIEGLFDVAEEENRNFEMFPSIGPFFATSE
jgi:hypothetical protein